MNFLTIFGILGVFAVSSIQSIRMQKDIDIWNGLDGSEIYIFRRNAIPPHLPPPGHTLASDLVKNVVQGTFNHIIEGQHTGQGHGEPGQPPMPINGKGPAPATLKTNGGDPIGAAAAS